MSSAKTIQVNYLARVEGEGGLYVKARDGRVTDVQLRIFEPPRFFEALLRGRSYAEAPDITARICGICPVAYQMSACQAIEAACGVQVTGAIRELRRLLYCGEWIESHALHVYLLHAPDFLGYPDAIRLATDHPAVVERGLQLKKVGNAIMTLLGGREIHPVNVRVGGFYRVPTRRQFAPLAERLRWARDAALDTVRWVATLPFPDFEQDYEFVALRHPTEYPVNEGRIVSNRGLDIAVADYEAHFVETHVAHSNALHSHLRERGAYMTGPLARYNLNADQLSPLAREAARDAGLGPVCRNPFRSIIVRSVELVYACDEALRIIEAYEPPALPAVPLTPRAAVGHGCTEAPRGSL
jgi:coenzyme F420-reducing hydrogenase alpha subunit